MRSCIAWLRKTDVPKVSEGRKRSNLKFPRADLNKCPLLGCDPTSADGARRPFRGRGASRRAGASIVGKGSISVAGLVAYSARRADRPKVDAANGSDGWKAGLPLRPRVHAQPRLEASNDFARLALSLRQATQAGIPWLAGSPGERLSESRLLSEHH